MGELLGLSRWAQLIPETVKERQVDESWRCDPRTTHHLKRKEPWAMECSGLKTLKNGP